MEAQKLDEACPPSALPPDRAQWGSGWVRVVTVGGQGCPCGGTHVRDTKELGRVRVEAVKVKGKVRRVSMHTGRTILPSRGAIEDELDAPHVFGIPAKPTFFYLVIGYMGTAVVAFGVRAVSGSVE